ncbi:MAG: FUSC family protein [Candidatus Acidiferrales bacterium]
MLANRPHLNLTVAHIRQAVQTATAGVLAMYLSRYLGLPEGYWAAITAVIVVQASLGAALKESWVRVAATAIGAAVAIPVVSYFGRSLLIFGAALFVTVLVCSSLRLTAGLRVAGTTVAIIMLIPRPGTPWGPGIHRFLEVSFGIIVALVVAKFVWPAAALEDLRTSLAGTYSQLHSLCVGLLQRYRGEPHLDIEALRGAIAAAQRRNEDLHEQATYELVFGRKNPKVLAAMNEHAIRIVRKLDALDVATTQPPEPQDKLRAQLELELNALGAVVTECLTQLAEGLSSKRFAGTALDLQTATQALETEAAKLRANPVFAESPLQATLQLDALCLALQSLAGELAATQSTARGATL